MRFLLVAAALALTSISSAQAIAIKPLEGAVRRLYEGQLIPRPEQEIPTQPQPGQNPPPREGRLPPAFPGREDQQFIFSNTGTVQRQGTKVLYRGNVRLLHRGWELFADEVTGDTVTEIFTARGNVRLFGQDAVIRGESVTVNFQYETFSALETDADLKPSLVEGRVRGDIYVRGEKFSGSEREVFGENCDVTTCNLDTPHYHIHGANVTIRPGKRAIFRKVDIKLFNRTILRLPYLSVPLDERFYRYLPEVGYGEEEGYFAKFRFGIPLRGENTHLDTRVDYYTRLGTGLGAELDYYSGRRMEGSFDVYGIIGERPSFLASSRHRQDLGWANFTLENSFQRSNYLTAPESTILNSRFLFTIPQRGATTRIGFLRNQNDSGNFRTEQQTYSISDNRVFSRSLRTFLDVGYGQSQSTSGGGTSRSREQVDLKFRAESDLQRATAQFEYQRSIPVGETTNFFSASDRTPVISLMTDSRRLLGTRGRDFAFPFRTEISFGEFVDSRSRDRISRGNFDLQFNKPARAQDRLRFDVNGRFKQGVYSDDTAQYILGLNTGLTYALGSDTALNLRYNYLRPYGFSPLQIDRTGRSNLLNADLSIRPLRSMLFGVATSYDLLQLERKNPGWQAVGLRLEYLPTDYLALRAFSTYDSFSEAWNDLRIDLAYRPGATFVSFGAKYDAVRKVWGQANLFVDALKIGRTKVSAMLAFNGYIKEFEARHLQFTYDLHCAEAILTIIDNPVGFRRGTQITFFVRIKALPFDTPFGIGRQGQPLGTGTGRGF